MRTKSIVSGKMSNHTRTLRRFALFFVAVFFVVAADKSPNVALANSDFPPMNSSGDYSGLYSPGLDASGHVLTHSTFLDAIINHSNFSSTICDSCRFLRADVADSDFKNANLSNATFLSANLKNTKFIGANLTGADFQGADLTEANFSGANLTNVNFEGANLGSVILKDANLTGVHSGFDGLVTQIPSGWQQVSRYLVGKTANLDHAQLDGLQLSHLNLDNITLRYASLVGADLSYSSLVQVSMRSTNLTRANLEGATIGVGSLDSDFSEADLINADLRWSFFSFANFSGADLAGAKLLGVNLDHATLTNSNLTGVSSGLVVGTPFDLNPSWTILKGYLVGPGADLRGALLSETDFAGLDLSNADLEGANFSNSDLSKTLLDGAISGQIVGTPLLPPGWTLSSGFFGLGQALIGTPRISGNARAGQILTIFPGEWDSGAHLAFQWARDGLPILGATDIAYIPRLNDRGSLISASVTSTIRNHLPVSASASAVRVSLDSFSKATAPTILGIFKVGNILTARVSHWSTNSTISFQWLLDSKVVRGQTTARLRLSKAMVGHSISVLCSQKAVGYSTLSKVSKIQKVR